jgi:hypothetical protein
MNENGKPKDRLRADLTKATDSKGECKPVREDPSHGIRQLYVVV